MNNDGTSYSLQWSTGYTYMVNILCVLLCELCWALTSSSKGGISFSGQKYKSKYKWPI